MLIKIRRARAKITFSETQIQQIEKLASNMTIAKVAEQFGISEETFCEVLRRQKSAMRAYKRGRTIEALRAGKTLRERMIAGDTGATIFFSKLYGLWDNEQKHEIIDKFPTAPTFKIVINKNH